MSPWSPLGARCLPAPSWHIGVCGWVGGGGGHSTRAWALQDVRQFWEGRGGIGGGHSAQSVCRAAHPSSSEDSHYHLLTSVNGCDSGRRLCSPPTVVFLFHRLPQQQTAGSFTLGSVFTSQQMFEAKEQIYNPAEGSWLPSSFSLLTASCCASLKRCFHSAPGNHCGSLYQSSPSWLVTPARFPTTWCAKGNVCKHAQSSG